MPEKTQETKGKKPFITDSTMYDAEKMALLEQGGPNFIPGWSERQKANDLNMGKLSSAHKETYFRRFGSGPGKQQFMFTWLPMSNPAGGYSTRAAHDRIEYEKQGFSVVKVNPAEAEKELKERFGIGMPHGAHVETDGTIRQIDDALFFVATENPRYVAAMALKAERAAVRSTGEDKVGERSFVPIENRVEEFGTEAVPYAPATK